MNKHDKDLRLDVSLDKDSHIDNVITEEEKREILEHEALVAELTESWEEVEQKIMESMAEAKMYGFRNGHPAQED